jgi:hypothetical protein
MSSGTRSPDEAKAPAKSSSRRPRSKPISHSGALSRLTESLRKGELVVITGTGVSLGLTDAKVPALSWKGLIEDGFAFAVSKGKIAKAQAKAWRAQLNSKDPDEFLGAAEFLGRKLEGPHGDLYARWFEHVFKPIQPTNSEMKDAILAMHSAGVPLATLNYDGLLEKVTGLPTIKLSETGKVADWIRREIKGVLHLHGSWDDPASCVLGIRDYEKTVGNELRDLFQRDLAAFRRLLFVGCGDTFADPNFGALIKWLRTNMKTAAPEHVALVRESEVAARNADPTWHGFVEPLSFGSDRKALPGFLIEHFPRPTKTSTARKRDSVKAFGSNSGHARLLQEYRAFLIKDCGQMTIEGVRADLDTAQRRFDLERLFVPLDLLAVPPELPENDPQREQKLLKWQEQHNAAQGFGKVFGKQRRLALLALPGGGKSLLLKRLAVAYADPSRREASKDGLPEVDLTPVLIRCREWREHIQRPIPSLLERLPDITGHPELAGLGEALRPLFKKGTALLLVDGLDEIRDNAERSTLVENLERFIDEHKHVPLVVTSREAGFSLVAPAIARFCERWRVAPLEADAIQSLCAHWHQIMTGDSPEARAEAKNVAETLLSSPSLLRLAENPLLLTMLLVVKQGAGRLPPDRVSLYGRAVEVLLDTWNIRGHEPLNVKEAVPQLAFVAFQLMRAGKQTATESELLALIERARKDVPQIRRYAKGTPYEFLKRVELRSSLLLEAGHQVERGMTVPFYQFRHLTFQEYLAAVAAFEGHYTGYETDHTVLAPLTDHLTAEEWKEVIPMAAVLAGKKAEPLMAELVKECSRLRRSVEAGEDFAGRDEWREKSTLPAPAARLVQCLVEEAQAAPETLSTSLQLAAFFASGFVVGSAAWPPLSRGPYGQELLHQAWLLFAPMRWPRETWLITTCALIAWLRDPELAGGTTEGRAELLRLLHSDQEEEVARGLFVCLGALFNETSGDKSGHSVISKDEIEEKLFRENPAIWAPAAFALGILPYQRRGAQWLPSPRALDRLLELWLGDRVESIAEYLDRALVFQLGRLPRRGWTPMLSKKQVVQVRQVGGSTEGQDDRQRRYGAALTVAFYAGNVWPEEELAARLDRARDIFFSGADLRGDVDRALEQMGAAGRKYLKAKKPAVKTRTKRR